MKTIDFIILNWRSYDKTIQCIDSIKGQIGNYKNRIIVVDNQFDKKKSQSIQKRVDILVTNKKNIGFAAGVNSASAFVKSEFIVLLNNDATMEKNWLNKMIPIFDDKEVGIVGGLEINPSGEKLGVPTVNPKTGFVIQAKIIKKLSIVPFVTASNIIIRSKIMKKLGWLDEKYFAYYEDIDLCAKILSIGKKVMFNPAAKIKHEVNYSSNRMPFRKQYLICKNRYRFMSKIMPTTKLIVFLLRNIFIDLLIAPIAAVIQYPNRHKSQLEKDRFYRRLARLKSGLWALLNLFNLIILSRQTQIYYQNKIYELLSDFYYQH